MKPRSDAIKLIGLVVVVLASSQALGAQRTFVASTGSDANPCTFAAPCRSFAAAIAVTDPSGEVIVTDSAGYGAVTITQSVAIIAAPGVYAGLSVFTGQNGITVNAGPSDKVVLRGLTINGQGGNEGIWVLSGGEVHIEDCVIANLGDRGVLIEGGDKIHISDSVIRSNAQGGVNITAGSPSVSIRDSDILENAPGSIFSNDNAGIRQLVGDLTTNRVQIRGNGRNGLGIFPLDDTTVRANVIDTEINENNGWAIDAFISSSTTNAVIQIDVTRGIAARNGNGYLMQVSSATSSGRISLTESVAVDNSGAGFWARGANSILTVQRSKAMGNISGFRRDGGVFNSCGDNLVRENATNISGVVSVVACTD